MPRPTAAETAAFVAAGEAYRAEHGLIPGTGDAPPGMAATAAEASIYSAAGQPIPVAPLSEVKTMTNAAALPASLAGLIPGALGALGAAGGGLATVAGIAGAAYGLYEALGGGEGEGIFGLDILGGGDVSGVGTGAYIDGIPLGGPGLAEPPAAWIEKEWTTVQGGTKCQFYLVRMPTGGKRVAMYNFSTRAWKSWPLRKSSTAYIGKKLPSHKMITRLRRNLGKHSSDARTILKITSPASLATYSRRRRR